MWHFRGTPPYIAAQARRLGLSEPMAAHCKHNAEIHRVSILLGQLCDRWHRCRKEDDRPVVGPLDARRSRPRWDEAEDESLKLHALAASAA